MILKIWILTNLNFICMHLFLLTENLLNALNLKVSFVKVIFASLFDILKCSIFLITGALLLLVMAGTTRPLKPILRELTVQQWWEQQQTVVCLTTISSPTTRISYSIDIDSTTKIYKSIECYFVQPASHRKDTYQTLYSKNSSWILTLFFFCTRITQCLKKKIWF